MYRIRVNTKQRQKLFLTTKYFFEANMTKLILNVLKHFDHTKEDGQWIKEELLAI